MKDNSETRYGTRAVWAGEEKIFAEGATQVPVFNTVTFGYDDLDQWYDVALGKRAGHIYSRNTNPTVQVFEDKMKALENAEAATSFATGMAAISNTLFTFLRPGDRLASIKDTYGGTSKIFLDFLPRMDVDVCLVDTGDHGPPLKGVSKRANWSGLSYTLHGVQCNRDYLPPVERLFWAFRRRLNNVEFHTIFRTVFVSAGAGGIRRCHRTG